MKIFYSFVIITFPALFTFAQMQRPMASPQGKVEQKVGLTDLKIEYYRPSKNNRTVFGEVVPFEEVWRTGANENAKFTSNDPVIFGKDTLKAGTYAIFTKPSKDSWEIIFYSDYSNWGTPDEWDEKKVVLRTKAAVVALNDVVESFTIGFDKLTTKSAELTFSWDKTRAVLPFSVPTAVKMQANIDKVMNGPSSGDYHAAAEFYFKEKKELKKALEWETKAIELRPDAYWYVSMKAQIQAELGDYKGAIESAKRSMELAEKAGDKNSVDASKKSIETWEKKK
jgi:tetratricopeptide (TPR) repeat protein